ncbi:MAG TPA: hypothetical protein PLF40_01055 [Kofleriaceae bacterium]|nr:hypothetical protein [Kofleriaceae bacterium]
MEQSAFVPDAVWIAAFEAEATAPTLLLVRRYALLRGRGVARAGGRSDAAYADELVQDALSDTIAGVVCWDPSRYRLATHLIGVIRSRSRHERARSMRFRHEAWSESLLARMSVDSPSEREYDRAAVAQQALHALRDAARGDREVLKILDAYAAGAVDKADVLQASGLKPARYTRARKRLRRKTLQLAPELRAAARAA